MIAVGVYYKGTQVKPKGVKVINYKFGRIKICCIIELLFIVMNSVLIPKSEQHASSFCILKWKPLKRNVMLI